MINLNDAHYYALEIEERLAVANEFNAKPIICISREDFVPLWNEHYRYGSFTNTDRFFIPLGERSRLTYLPWIERGGAPVIAFTAKDMFSVNPIPYLKGWFTMKTKYAAAQPFAY